MDSDQCATRKKDPDETDRPSPPAYNSTSLVQGDSPTLTPKLAVAFKAEFNPATNDSIPEKIPCVSFTTEETEEGKQDSVPRESHRRKWRRASLTVAAASLIASVIFCAASFFASATMDSSAVLASALDTFLAVFSASIVIWRFRDNKNVKVGPKREKYGSIGFGVAFIVNSVITITVCIFQVVEEKTPKHTDIMWPVLLGFSSIYFILATSEYWIFKRFKSSVLFSLCIDDAVTCGLLFGLASGTLVMDQVGHLWYLDHVLALGLSLAILACGIKILVAIFVYHELPFQMLSSEF